MALELAALLVEVAAAERAVKTYDDQHGATVIKFGRWSGQTYAWVAQNSPKYMEWVLSLWDVTGQMFELRNFLLERWQLSSPLRTLTVASQRQLDEARAEEARQRELARAEEARQRELARVAKANEAARVLKERRRTTRPDHLLDLANDASFFRAAILDRLTMYSLIALTLVCRAMRDATSKSPCWSDAVGGCMARRRLTIHDSRKLNTHDHMMLRFFRIPVGLKLAPIVKGANGEVLNVADHEHASRVFCDNKAYMAIRNEVRLSIVDFKRKKTLLSKAVDVVKGIDWAPDTTLVDKTRKALQDALESVKKLDGNVKRVEAAVGAVIRFFVDNNIPTSLPTAYTASDLAVWESFATSRWYA